jgi:DNA-binding transcriptional LysR family regulator
MARRLDTLHMQAGARLLQKTPEGFVLTPAGERVLAGVERIEAEALTVERSIAGDDERIAGEVRITTVETFGARIITPVLHRLSELQPEIQIELITDNRSLSLSRREADIAIRLAAFEQHEVVVRRIADMAFGLFASRDYIERCGLPDLENGAPSHTVVTLQKDLALVPEARRMAELAPRATIVMRSNSRDVHLHAVRQGCGIAMLPCYLACGDADLVELPIPGGRVVRGIWLGVLRDTRQVRRIRLVLDLITSEIKAWADKLVPPDAPRSLERA